VPSGYEAPRVPLLKKKCFGDPAPNNQASARRRSARSTAPSGVVGMQSPDEAATRGGLSEDHRRTLISRIVITREGSLTKRIERAFGQVKESSR
jgi:hypothetical protein